MHNFENDENEKIKKESICVNIRSRVYEIDLARKISIAC